MKVIAEQFKLPMATPAEGAKARTTKAFLSAYRAGRKAAEHGQMKMPPYRNHQDWRRPFRHFWLEGFVDFENGKPERYEAG